MTFIRSRIMLALIGLVMIGVISAAVAVMTTPQPSRAALVGSGRTNSDGAGSASATATAATGGGGSTTTAGTSANTSPAATTPPGPPPNNTTASGGQLIDLHGTVASVNVSGGTFTLTDGTLVTVTSATAFTGDARSLSALRAGWLVEAKGTRQASGSFSAVSVDANSGL